VFKKTDWMVWLGAALILFASLNFWVRYQAAAPSPFDMADGGTEENGFLPIVVPAEAVPGPAAPTIAGGQGTGPGFGTGFPGVVPNRLVIPALKLDAPVVSVHYKDIESGGTVYHQWRVPAGFAAGWQDTSALLGRAGNTVLNGHHNAHGMVFKDLVKLQEGDLIQVYGGGWKQTFEVAAKLLLPERGQPLDTRLDNARWMEASDDQRLTLVTCWPSESNTHRVIIVAFPVGDPIRQGAPVGSGGE
jgi:sortase A